VLTERGAVLVDQLGQAVVNLRPHLVRSPALNSPWELEREVHIAPMATLRCAAIAEEPRHLFQGLRSPTIRPVAGAHARWPPGAPAWARCEPRLSSASVDLVDDDGRVVRRISRGAAVA
jgi:hypothetical protein